MKCSDCQEEIPNGLAFVVDGKIVCPKHWAMISPGDAVGAVQLKFSYPLPKGSGGA